MRSNEPIAHRKFVDTKFSKNQSILIGRASVPIHLKNRVQVIDLFVVPE